MAIFSSLGDNTLCWLMDNCYVQRHHLPWNSEESLNHMEVIFSYGTIDNFLGVVFAPVLMGLVGIWDCQKGNNMGSRILHRCNCLPLDPYFRAYLSGDVGLNALPTQIGEEQCSEVWFLNSLVSFGCGL